MNKAKIHTEEELEEILDQVPPNYYQKSFTKYLWHAQKLKIVLTLIDIKADRILDVGCASGWFLNEISKRYPSSKLDGIDASQKSVDYGNKEYKNLNLVFADAHKMPFKDKTFDIVICAEVLNHVVNPKKVLEEIKRVLKPNGTVIIEIEDSQSYLFRLIWYFWIHLPGSVWNHAHIHDFSFKNLGEIIKESGFRIKRKKIFLLGMGIAFQLKI